MPWAPGGAHGASNRNHGILPGERHRGGADVSPKVTTAPPPHAAAGRSVTVEIAAEKMAFDTSTITVPAGAEVTMNFENRDDGIPHNVAVYTDPSAAKEIFVGDIIAGPERATYTFTAPETPGTYFFRCDVHPSMNGAFIVT